MNDLFDRLNFAAEMTASAKDRQIRTAAKLVADRALREHGPWFGESRKRAFWERHHETAIAAMRWRDIIEWAHREARKTPLSLN